MAKFLGLFFLLGIDQLPTIRHYWKTQGLHNYPLFRSIMTRKRFRIILKHFHGFSSCGEPTKNMNKLIKICTVMEYLLCRFKSAYTLHDHICIDEGTMGWKGCLSFCVYNPVKSQKYGIKVYILAESSSEYVWNIEVYNG